MVVNRLEHAPCLLQLNEEQFRLLDCRLIESRIANGELQYVEMLFVCSYKDCHRLTYFYQHPFIVQVSPLDGMSFPESFDPPHGKFRLRFVSAINQGAQGNHLIHAKFFPYWGKEW